MCVCLSVFSQNKSLKRGVNMTLIRTMIRTMMLVMTIMLTTSMSRGVHHVTWFPSPGPRPSNVTKVTFTSTEMKWTPITTSFHVLLELQAN